LCGSRKTARPCDLDISDAAKKHSDLRQLIAMPIDGIAIDNSPKLGRKMSRSLLDAAASDLVLHRLQGIESTAPSELTKAIREGKIRNGTAQSLQYLLTSTQGLFVLVAQRLRAQDFSDRQDYVTGEETHPNGTGHLFELRIVVHCHHLRDISVDDLDSPCWYLFIG
jgi:hypothetical protein